VTLQLQPDSVPVFMMEPMLLGSPLVAKDFDSAGDQPSVPTIVSPTSVCAAILLVSCLTGLIFCSYCNVFVVSKHNVSA